jgi:NAD(P)-dependent dehydrogenase (short-subunit alcohol dehydrogenase family)
VVRDEIAIRFAGAAAYPGRWLVSRRPARVRINCICPGWIETPDVRRALQALPAQDRGRLPYPPPATMILPHQLASLVILLTRHEEIAGRVVAWPDEGAWQL